MTYTIKFTARRVYCESGGVGSVSIEQYIMMCKYIRQCIQYSVTGIHVDYVVDHLLGAHINQVNVTSVDRLSKRIRNIQPGQDWCFETITNLAYCFHHQETQCETFQPYQGLKFSIFRTAHQNLNKRPQPMYIFLQMYSNKYHRNCVR